MTARRASRRFGEPGKVTTMLDTWASEARTALTDPEALGFPHSARDAVDYAVARLDAIIEALNPSTETRATAARTLTILGRHLAERSDVYAATDAEGDDADAYRDASDAIDRALDLLDEAVDAVEPGVDARAELLYPGDPVAQLVYGTLIARGYSPEQAEEGMDAAYDYDPFGRLVDDVERAIPANDGELPEGFPS
ncbi:MAG TPA: hypothetical protein VHS03_11685 [Gaiellaceae bacterium]|jgi:hypothetical protein|nr:hypothetical protein [Gaiellaceae bacterium]